LNKIKLRALLCTGFYDGGDYPDIEPVTYVNVDTPEANPFYVGAGFGTDTEKDKYYDVIPSLDHDIDEQYFNASILVGAVVATEGALDLAIEGRASISTDTYGVDAWGIYAKPELNVDDQFTLFGIIGYQQITTYDNQYDATGLGAGGTFLFTDSVGIQLDYIYSFIAEDEFGYVPEYTNVTASLLYKF
jgi:hypothetical protein